MNSNYTLKLGSRSPRRRQILLDAGFNFSVVPIDAEEHYPRRLAPTKVAEYIANRKAKAYQGDVNSSILITADTTVMIDNNLLGKPRSNKEAIRILKTLSGATHLVVTGVCLRSLHKTVSFSETTEVTFRSLADSEIKFYVDQFQPLDKAGAYGIQEWLGLIGVEHIAGSYYNVVGMPVHRLIEVLRKEFSYQPYSH